MHFFLVGGSHKHVYYREQSCFWINMWYVFTLAVVGIWRRRSVSWLLILVLYTIWRVSFVPDWFFSLLHGWKEIFVANLLYLNFTRAAIIVHTLSLQKTEMLNLTLLSFFSAFVKPVIRQRELYLALLFELQYKVSYMSPI